MDAILFVSGKKTYSYEPGDGIGATQRFRDCSRDKSILQFSARKKQSIEVDSQRCSAMFYRDTQDPVVLAQA